MVSAIALAPPARSIHERNDSPASRSSANRPTTRTAACGAVLAGSRSAFSPKWMLLLADVAAEQQLVAGGAAAVGPALGAEEPDVGDVVLAAAVRAARDVGADAADLGQAGLVEGDADGVGEAAALGDGEVAGVGAGAGDDVAGQLGAGLGHADRRQPVEQRPQLRLATAPGTRGSAGS